MNTGIITIIGLLVCVGVLCLNGERKFNRLIPPSACQTATCPPERNYEPWKQLCAYNCTDGNRYFCLENEDGKQVTEFCAPILECEPGQKGFFTIDEDDATKVVMTVAPCPPDKYQTHNSNCIDACTRSRNNFIRLPERFAIYSNGSNNQAPQVYCNYTAGFYNTNNITFFNYDHEFHHYFGGYCVHVSIKDPCVAGLKPLPNGTCVVPCAQGQVRDAYDSFLCKPRTSESSNKSATVGTTQITIDVNSTTKTDGDKVSEDLKPWIKAVIVVVVLLIVVVIIVIVCVCVMKKRQKDRRNKIKETQNEDIEEQIPLNDLEQNADDVAGSSSINIEKRDSITTSFIEKPAEEPMANGVHQATVEPIPKKEENGSIRSSAQDADVIKLKKAMNGGHAGELKKKHNDTLTTFAFTSLTTQPESVGVLIINGNIGGTVFRVGTCCVMTAFHVISPIVTRDNNEEDENNVDLSLLTNEAIYVHFNESVAEKPRIVSTLVCVFYDRDLDVAVLKFEIISGLPRKMILDRSSSTDPNIVHIIGYGHPENNMKKHVDPSCEVVPANSYKIKRALAWLKENATKYRMLVPDASHIDYGYHRYDDDHKIILNCYLEHGASGAPLLTVDSRGCVKVVGFLTHGMPDFYFDLPAEDQRAFPKDYRFEYGTRMKRIYKAIQNQDPELAEDIFGEM